uniref:CIDE-N domain-containing protein n=1 Tax=Ficedula albicollis TaxID=59894 RepID=A0A803V413_FICAL
MTVDLRAVRCSGPQRFGVTARSLRGLLRKGCRLLQLPLANSCLFCHMDGVELTRSRFRVLLPWMEPGLLSPRENWWGCISNIERQTPPNCIP